MKFEFVLSAIFMAVFLLLAAPTLAATTPAQIPDSWIKNLDDGGFLIKNRPIIIVHCKQPLMMVIPTAESGQYTVYDGEAMRAKAREVLRSQYLLFNIAPIMGVDCSAPDNPQKPKRKKFFRMISD